MFAGADVLGNGVYPVLLVLLSLCDRLGHLFGGHVLVDLDPHPLGLQFKAGLFQGRHLLRLGLFAESLD